MHVETIQAEWAEIPYSVKRDMVYNARARMSWLKWLIRDRDSTRFWLRDYLTEAIEKRIRNRIDSDAADAAGERWEDRSL